MRDKPCKDWRSMSQFWRSGAVIAAVLFLEACAFYTIGAIASAGLRLPEVRLPFWMVLLAVAWAFLLSLYVQTTRLSLNLRGVVGLTVSLVLLLLLANWSTGLGVFPVGKVMGGVHAAVTLAVIVVLLLFIWWRGASIAQDEMGLETVRGSFQWGLMVVFLAVIINSFSSARVVSGFLIVGYFALGLGGMALARFTSETGKDMGISRQWLMLIGASIGAVVLAGLLISMLGLGGLDDVTRAILRLVGTVGGWILRPFILASGYLVGLLVEFSHWLAQRLGGGDLSNFDLAQEQIRQFQENMARQGAGKSPPTALLMALRWLAFLAASFLIVWVLFRVFRFRRPWRTSGEVEETRESLFTWTGAGNDLSTLLGDWWDNLVKASEREGCRQAVARDARQIYYGLLALARRLGRPRQEWQTPVEHQSVMQGLLPDEPVARIVGDFQAVHYGQGQLDEAELARLQEAWAAVSKPQSGGLAK